MMFGLGWLFMLLVIGLPVVILVMALVGRGDQLRQIWTPRASVQSDPSVSAPMQVDRDPAITPPTRYCSHCSAGLQAEWSHCPQCGAPIQ
jgi:hypothetical protein